MLFADAGTEAWAVRQISQVQEVRDLAARVTALRLSIAAVVYGLLLCLLVWIPDRPPLRGVLALFGLSLFPQAASLKWVFMGEQEATIVSVGLIVGQLVFAGATLMIVHHPAEILWVPGLKLASEAALAAYFMWRFARQHGALPLVFPLRGGLKILRPAAVLGFSAAFHLINYNFDSVILGFMLGATTVGWYSAAYKPVTVALALPMTFFVGLYPALTRSYAEDRDGFRMVVLQSLRLTSSLAVPLGVGGAILARPIIGLLFGPAYEPSIPVLRILVWSAVLVILRGPFHLGLRAANRSGVELRCAMICAGVNVALNIALIPRYGMTGAAAATLTAELIWIGLVVNRMNRYVMDVSLLPYLWRPCLAGIAMAACFWLADPIPWMLRAILSVGFYFAALLLLGGAKWREWLPPLKPRPVG